MFFGMHDGALGLGALVYLVLVILFLVANWQIVSKAGYSGWLSLLVLVPLVNVIFYLWFAFSDWPALRGR